MAVVSLTSSSARSYINNICAYNQFAPTNWAVRQPELRPIRADVSTVHNQVFMNLEKNIGYTRSSAEVIHHALYHHHFPSSKLAHAKDLWKINACDRIRYLCIRLNTLNVYDNKKHKSAVSKKSPWMAQSVSNSQASPYWAESETLPPLRGLRDARAR